MKYWVQFLTQSAIDKTQLIDACGDTCVFILDGRNSSETMRRDALRRAQQLEHWRKYPAFRIVRGARFLEESNTSRVHTLSYPIQTD